MWRWIGAELLGLGNTWRLFRFDPIIFWLWTSLVVAKLNLTVLSVAIEYNIKVAFPSNRG